MDPAHETMNVEGGAHIKMWTRGVPVEDEAREQLARTAKLPFIFRHIAVMPDVHVGKGSTVGSVIPTRHAVIPAAVGVDIGCGMIAARTTLSAADLPDNLGRVRGAIEKAVPHGRSPGKRDRGAWGDAPPPNAAAAWRLLEPDFQRIADKYPPLARANSRAHLGTLGTGNHFVEVCLDETDAVWFMLHSGSRGVGNAIGRHFIELAREDMRTWMINLPDQDLAYFPEGTQHFDDYVEAVEWAQGAKLGELGIIPGSMGARSFIVRGLGNDASFHSCSHGAGRKMSRTEARKRFTVEDHLAATQGVECRKDADVIDETPAAYKDIDAVMDAQRDLVEIVHTLKQVVCVKG